jgi:hypothetical protein
VSGIKEPYDVHAGLVWWVGWLLLLSNSGCSRGEMVAIANRKELVFLTIKKTQLAAAC